MRPSFMVSHNCKTKKNAEQMASRLRKKGMNTSIYKKKDGWGVSSTK